MTGRLLAESIIDRQIALEQEQVEAGIKRYRDDVVGAIERGEGASLKACERIMGHWFAPMKEAVISTRRMFAAKAARGTRVAGKAWGPFLSVANADELAAVTIIDCVQSAIERPDGEEIVSIAYKIGRDCYAQACTRMLRRSNREQFNELERRMKRKVPQKYIKMARMDFESDELTKRSFISLGVQLWWLLVGCASLDDYDRPFRNAFHFEKRWRRGYNVRCSIPDPGLLEIIADGHRRRESLRPRFLPMVAPPVNWTQDQEGGYYRVRTPMILKSTSRQRKAARDNDMTTVHEALNALNATPAAINPLVVRNARAYWDRGGGSFRVPRADDYDIPARPPECDSDHEAHVAWKRRAAAEHKKNQILISEREAFLRRLGVAERFMEERCIYFPHAFDFRGRVYPVPSEVSYHGHDLSRAMIRLAEPKPMTERGEYWLKVHCANCFGMDKVSFDDRVAWTEDQIKAGNFDGLLDDPISHPMFRSLSGPKDKPWQFLAAVEGVLDPDGAGRHVPVQMDGSCNGLQHYAAMLRDEDAAQWVNLVPGDAPRDIYSELARRVCEVLNSDDHEFSVALRGHVGRNTVKQRVMTDNYGVTEVGGRAMIEAALRKSGFVFPKFYEVTRHLSRIVSRELEGVCPASTRAMRWLKECASIIAKSGRDLRWTSPLGFQVVQPYRKRFRAYKATVIGRVEYAVAENTPVSASRQVRGAPPNFLHSIDSAHLGFAAIAGRDERIFILTTHDGYSTCPADVDSLRQILLEQFVALHDTPQLNRAAEQWSDQHPGLSFPDPPPLGRLDLMSLLESPYAFS